MCCWVPGMHAYGPLTQCAVERLQAESRFGVSTAAPQGRQASLALNALQSSRYGRQATRLTDTQFHRGWRTSAAKQATAIIAASAANAHSIAYSVQRYKVQGAIAEHRVLSCRKTSLLQRNWPCQLCLWALKLTVHARHQQPVQVSTGWHLQCNTQPRNCRHRPPGVSARSKQKAGDDWGALP